MEISGSKSPLLAPLPSAGKNFHFSQPTEEFPLFSSGVIHFFEISIQMRFVYAFPYPVAWLALILALCIVVAVAPTRREPRAAQDESDAD